MSLPERLDFSVGDTLTSTVTENTWLVKGVLRGGVGIVYIVEDVPRTVTYALKTFQARYLSSDVERDRFEREALVWVSLRPHPNVVSALWMERIEGFPCLVLEYIPGGDLERKLRNGPLKVETALPLAFQLCDGLAYLHAKTDIIHRDIRPANCLLEGTQLRIADFGLAWTHVLAERSDQDAGQELKSIRETSQLGTLPYKASEQNYTSSILDVRTDIHAFGVTFYTMLAGLPTPQWLTPVDRHIAAEGPKLGVPQPVLELILQCAAYDPQHRPQNFVRLRQQLDTVASRMNQTVPPPPVPLQMSSLDYENKAVGFIMLGRYRDAEVLLDQSLRAFPDNPDFWKNKGVALYWQDKYREAIACYDRALDLRPQDPYVLNNKGAALKAMGNIKDAIRCYEKGLQQQQCDPVLQGNLGEALHILGRLTDALSCYEQGLRACPRDVNLLEKKALALLDLKRYAEALACIETALNIAPGQWNLWLTKGKILHNLREFDRAVRSYDNALRFSDKKKVEPYKNRAKALLYLKRYDDALASYNSALAISSDPEVWKGKGATLFLKDQPDEALPWLMKAVEADGQDYGTYENLGAVLLALRRPVEALKWLKQGVKLNSNDPHLWGNLGLARQALGQYRRALKCYSRALAIDPNDSVLWREKARTLNALGRFDEAVECELRANRLDQSQSSTAIGVTESHSS